MELSLPCHEITFVDRGHKVRRSKPNPAFPNGMQVDMSKGAARACEVSLPYPAERCGVWEVKCRTCGICIALTCAGRPDDPCAVKIPCYAHLMRQEG